jgi:iron complex transport system permease protein
MIRSRPTLVVSVLAIGVLAVVLVSLATGDYPLSLGQVLKALFDPDASFGTTIVREWRLPRVLAALLFGAALGVSGAIFQSLTRNPLGSPDIIGFSTGSYTGVLIVIILLGNSTISTGVGALVGGIITALVVYLLAYRRGVLGFRLIIVGIGVTAMLHAVNVYLLLRADTEVAMSASIWGAGSISLVGWPQAGPAFIALAVLTPFVVALRRPLSQLELGDDTARSHGVRVEPVRLALIIVGVALTAVVTAVAGPIAFIALSAPQIAKRLTRGAGLSFLPSAITGALLLLVADFIGQHAFTGGIPVGIVTVVIGGVYLITLLVREARRRG